jgi:hypothetical protein
MHRVLARKHAVEMLKFSINFQLPVIVAVYILYFVQICSVLLARPMLTCDLYHICVAARL